MLKLYYKLLLVCFYTLLTGCHPNGSLTDNLEPQGKAMFDPENRTLLGYKIYGKFENIDKDPNYTFLKKEDDVIYYNVNNRKNDPRQISLIVSVRNDKIYSVESRYQYANFSSCNTAAEKIYKETKDLFPLEKRTDISGKGYHFDGILKNYIFITACTDLLESDKIIHSTIYMR